MKRKSVDDSVTILSQLMMPADANNNGYVHGGNILRLVDQAAAVTAMKHAGNACVTASIDRVYFIEPIKIGELVTLKASINYVGRTSMDVGVRVISENLKTGKKRHTNSCYLTMVAVNAKGKPVPVPKLLCKTSEQHRRCKEAEQRRKEKLLTLRKYKREMKGKR